MNNDRETDERIVTADKPKNRKGLWMLLGLLLGLLLGSLLGGAVGSLFGDNIKDTTGTTNQSQNSNVTPVATTASIADRLSGTEGASGRYSMILAETSRESVDTPSAEATAAQTALTQATSQFANTLVSQGKAKGDVNQADLENKLGAVNNAIIKYTAAAGNTTPSETEVVSAVTDLRTFIEQSYTITNATSFKSLMTSFQNSMLEGSRNFVAEKYDESYAKHQVAQQDFIKAFALISTK